MKPERLLLIGYAAFFRSGYARRQGEDSRRKGSHIAAEIRGVQRSWVRVLRRPCDGAIGDEHANDTAAIQKTIDACAGHGGGWCSSATAGFLSAA